MQDHNATFDLVVTHEIILNRNKVRAIKIKVNGRQQYRGIYDDVDDDDDDDRATSVCIGRV